MTKVNSLEGKIKNYLDKKASQYPEGWKEIVAHDMVKICKKEYQIEYRVLNKSIMQLEKENAELKNYKKNVGIMLKLDLEKITNLKKVIKYLDGVSMLNEDLIRENDKLKQQLLNLSDENSKLGHDYKMFKDMYEDTNQQLKTLQDKSDNPIDIYSKTGEIINDKEGE